MYRISTLILAIFIPVIGLVQATFFDYIGFMGIKPDLLLITVIFFSLSCTMDIAIKSALIAGLMEDITSSSMLGSYTVSFLLLAIFLNYNQRRVYREAVHTQILVSFASYIFTSGLVIILGLISTKAPVAYFPYLSIIFKGALYTGLVSPLVFFSYSRLLKIHLAPTYF